MKVIEYSPLGIAIPDAEAEEYARNFLNGEHNLIVVSTDNFIYATRALVHDKVISHEEVEFLLNGRTLKMNADGRLTEWPDGFCDYHEKWLSRLLTP